MKHIRQDINECLLASVAMLTDEPREKIWKFADELARGREFHDYQDMMRRGRENILTQNKILQRFLGLQVVEHEKEDMHIGASPDENLDLSGTGFMAVYFENGEGHALAYESGLVHDPNLQGPVSWHEWLTVHAPAHYFAPPRAVELYPVKPVEVKSSKKNRAKRPNKILLDKGVSSVIR